KFLRGIAQGLSKMSPAPAGRQRPICPEIRWPHFLCISCAGRGAIAARGEALYGVRVGLAAPERIGPVAQWLEPTAHNGLVGGSNPPGPTTQSSATGDFLNALPKAPNWRGSVRRFVPQRPRCYGEAVASARFFLAPKFRFPETETARGRDSVRMRVTPKEVRASGAGETTRRACR